jgi:hypothetical protein
MSSSPPSRIGNIAFWLWVIGGIVWVALSSHYGDRLWSPDYVFCFVGDTPERVARCQEWERMAHFFRWWSFGYALAGLIVFGRREGCVVLFIAFAIVALSWFFQLAAGLGHL